MRARPSGVTTTQRLRASAPGTRSMKPACCSVRRLRVIVVRSVCSCSARAETVGGPSGALRACTSRLNCVPRRPLGASVSS